MGRMQTVAIVGAGPAGLVAAKVLLVDGFDVIVFEKNRTLGGIWSFEGSYYNLHTQQPGGTIEFSDLYDGEGKIDVFSTASIEYFYLEYASWEHVYEYLCRYASKFDLISRIRLRTCVISISKTNLHDAEESWSVKVERTTDVSSSTETFKFDFVVVANGLFSYYRVPTFRGQEKFSGSIMHANDIKRREQLINKNILVIGGSKSAIDMAVNVATLARHCDMIFRRIHLILPVKILRGHLPLRHLWCRFNCFLADLYPLAPHSRLFQLAHQYFKYILVAIRKKIAADLAVSNGPDLYKDGIFKPQYGSKDGLVSFPVQPIFAELKREDRIRGHIGSIEEIIDSNSVRLNTGKIFSPVDMIICSTGHYIHFPFFSDADARTMGLPHGTSADLDLYRRIVPINVPKIAFVGYTSSSRAWMIDEVASHWVSDYFKGVQLLPSREEMQKEIEIIRDFVRSQYGTTAPHIRFTWLEPLEIYLNDMKLPLQRANNWWSENFGVYRPNRFKTLHEERRARDSGLPFPYRFYFSFLHTVLILIAVLLGIFFRFFY